MKIKVQDKLIDVTDNHIWIYFGLQEMYDMFGTNFVFEMPNFILEEDVIDALNSKNGEAKTFPGLYVQDFLKGNIFRIKIDGEEIHSNNVKINSIQLRIDFDACTIRSNVEEMINNSRIETNFPHQYTTFTSEYNEYRYDTIGWIPAQTINERNLSFMQLCGRDSNLYRIVIKSILNFFKIKKPLSVPENIHYEIYSNSLFQEEIAKSCSTLNLNNEYREDDEKKKAWKATTVGGLLLQEQNGIEFYHTIYILNNSYFNHLKQSKEEKESNEDILCKVFEIEKNDPDKESIIKEFLSDLLKDNVTLKYKGRVMRRLIELKEYIISNISNQSYKLRIIHPRDVKIINIPIEERKHVFTMSNQYDDVYLDLKQNKIDMIYSTKYHVKFDKQTLMNRINNDYYQVRQTKLLDIYPNIHGNQDYIFNSTNLNLYYLSEKFWPLLKETKLIAFRNDVVRELLNNFQYNTLLIFFNGNQIRIENYVHFLREMASIRSAYNKEHGIF